jgi:hypothetical protein
MYAISRNQGVPSKINTEDLVHAANGLRPQHELMQEAKEGATQPQLDTALKVMVTDIVNRTALVDSDGDVVGTYNKVQPEDAKLPGQGS